MLEYRHEFYLIVLFPFFIINIIFFKTHKQTRENNVCDFILFYQSMTWWNYSPCQSHLKDEYALFLILKFIFL